MEKEIPTINRVDQIRDICQELQGSKVKVRANMGRSHIVERVGILIQAHPSLFVVEVNERRGRTARQSHQYVDILTGAVELFDGDSEEAIFETVEE